MTTRRPRAPARPILSRTSTRVAAALTAALFAAAVGACGGASAPSEASSTASGATTVSSGASRTSGMSSGGMTTAPSNDTARGQPQVSNSGVSGGGTAGHDLGYWQGQLDQATEALSSAGSECRDVCRASSDICVAAREICSLTGDADAAMPSDARCGRARAACERATRQQGSACPVCPSSR